MDALKALGCLLFVIAAFVALLVLAALAMNGLAWVSEHVIPYLFVAAEIAFAVCVIILFPLALFRRSRAVSAIGFLACSGHIRPMYVGYGLSSHFGILGHCWRANWAVSCSSRDRAAWDRRFCIPWRLGSSRLLNDRIGHNLQCEGHRLLARR